MTFYMSLAQSPFNAEAAAKTSRQFCILHVALNAETDTDYMWRIKPKNAHDAGNG